MSIKLLDCVFNVPFSLLLILEMKVLNCFQSLSFLELFLEFLYTRHRSIQKGPYRLPASSLYKYYSKLQANEILLILLELNSRVFIKLSKQLINSMRESFVQIFKHTDLRIVIVHVCLREAYSHRQLLSIQQFGTNAKTNCCFLVHRRTASKGRSQTRKTQKSRREIAFNSLLPTALQAWVVVGQILIAPLINHC
jgi:hypothetical protein